MTYSPWFEYNSDLAEAQYKPNSGEVILPREASLAVDRCTMSATSVLGICSFSILLDLSLFCIPS